MFWGGGWEGGDNFHLMTTGNRITTMATELFNARLRVFVVGLFNLVDYLYFFLNSFFRVISVHTVDRFWSTLWPLMDWFFFFFFVVILIQRVGVK